MFSRFSLPKVLTSVRFSSTLGSLKPNEGAVTAYKRVGRGASSGLGKTSGRGQKGQKARGSVPWWLEGGQTPYYKRFPIIGFKRPHRKDYNKVNLGTIQEFWDRGRIPLQSGETLTIRVMKECGLITGSLKDGAIILARGATSYNVPLDIEALKASELAISTIERANKTFTARYFTPLSLRAHVNPEKFLLKKGYVPLPARPTHRRDIEYYLSEEKRGYLLSDRSLLLDHMNNANKSHRVQKKKSSLERQSETASSVKHTDYSENRVYSLADL